MNKERQRKLDARAKRQESKTARYGTQTVQESTPKVESKKVSATTVKKTNTKKVAGKSSGTVAPVQKKKTGNTKRK